MYFSRKEILRKLHQCTFPGEGCIETADPCRHAMIGRSAVVPQDRQLTSVSAALRQGTQDDEKSVKKLFSAV